MKGPAGTGTWPEAEPQQQEWTPPPPETCWELYRKAYLARADLYFGPVFISLLAAVCWLRAVPFWALGAAVPGLFFAGVKVFVINGEPVPALAGRLRAPAEVLLWLCLHPSIGGTGVCVCVCVCVCVLISQAKAKHAWGGTISTCESRQARPTLGPLAQDRHLRVRRLHHPCTARLCATSGRPDAMHMVALIPSAHEHAC